MAEVCRISRRRRSPRSRARRALPRDRVDVGRAVRGHVVDGLGEQPDRGRGLGLRDDERRRHPDAVVAGLEDEQAGVEGPHLDGVGRLAGVELDADHQALAADVLDERRVRA